MSGRTLPRLYAILDAGAVKGAGLDLLEAATALRDAGVQLLQYRDKQASGPDVLAHAREIGRIFAGSGALLLLNDDPGLAVEAGWDGVHVGQSDGAVAAARAVVGAERLVGLSTHNAEQMLAARLTDADYIAVGPIFSTLTKWDAEPAIGLAGMRELRLLCDRPLVAIGGIACDQVSEVLAAGADSVAVIGALVTDGSVEENARALLRAAGAAAETRTSEDRAIAGKP